MSDASEPEPELAAAGPSNPKKVKRSAAEAGVLLKCPKCQKGYKTARGYKSHLLMHNVREAARRIVSPETIKKEALNLADDVLSDLSVKKPYGPTGPVFQDLCQKIRSIQSYPQWANFVDLYLTQILSYLPSKVMVPSAIKSEFLDKLHGLLANRDFKSQLASLHDCLVPRISVAENIVHLFLAHFGRELGKKVILLVLRSLRPAEVAAQSPGQQQMTLKLQKIIYYVVGSVVKSLRVQADLWKDLSP